MGFFKDFSASRRYHGSGGDFAGDCGVSSGKSRENKARYVREQNMKKRREEKNAS